jgi:hypothetical protein
MSKNYLKETALKIKNIIKINGTLLMFAAGITIMPTNT